jgi:hypothetical protein
VRLQVFIVDVYNKQRVILIPLTAFGAFYFDAAQAGLPSMVSATSAQLYQI